jgi:predicted DNA-binding protein
MEKKSRVRKRNAQFHLYLDEKVLNRLRAIAEREGRTITELIREAIGNLLREKGGRLNGYI